MRQTAQVKPPQDGRDASKDAAPRAGQTIDAWIEAALAEQAKRGTPKPNQELNDAAAESIERSKRLARGPTAAQTSGIETSTSTASGRDAAVGEGASGTPEPKLDMSERKAESDGRPVMTQPMKAIERIESRLGTPTVVEGVPTALEDTQHGFEARMKDLSDRLAGPRPIGRRGVAPADELGQAVAEIRSRQAAIEAGTLDRRAASPAFRPPLTVSSSDAPAVASPLRGYGDMLSSMRTDLARIAGKVESPRPPALDGLTNEIDALRSSLADLPKRQDLGAIEQSVAALAQEVTTIRRDGRAIDASHLDALQAELRRIGGAGDSADHVKLSRDLDVLSHKLDIVSASGIDPNAMAAMTKQLDEIRASLEGLASAREVAQLGQQIADLKRNVAAIGKSQIDPADFASLKGTVEEMRTTLARPVSGGQKSAGPVQLAQGQLEPIESMLTMLADKIDRVERQVADPEALDQLERQLAALTTVLGSSSGRDPSLATLEHAMTALLREVGSWRDGAAEIADRAARNAVAETVQSRSPGSDQVQHDDYVRHLAGLREDYAAVEQRVGRSLEGVQATLQGVVERLGGLDRPSGREASRRDPAPESQAVPPRPQAARRGDTGDVARRPTPSPRTAPPSEDAQLPTASAGEEILLEPGERPRGRAETGAPTIDPTDIKSSFIAAARRAAQAAAADAAASKGGRPESDVGTASRTDLLKRLRTLVETQRRPLLVGAAAIALALGGFQLTREKAVDRTASAASPVIATQAAGPATRPAPVATMRPATPDPQTTQSLAEGALDEAARGPIDAATGAAPVAAQPPVSQFASAPPAASPQGASSAPKADVLDTAKLATLAGPSSTTGTTPERPDQAAAITALRQSALGGNALALYDLGVRTSEGRGVPRDLQLGTTYFEKAAEKGLAPAQYRTGNAYEKGVGVARNVDLAKTWYKRAAEGGNTRAMHNLAVLIAEGAGGKPDYSAASGWFQRAAEQGVRDSQYNLAVLYARGLGTTQDFAKSYVWFAIAAGQGDEDAGRKRDEVAARLPASELTRVKAMVERWRPTPTNVAANEVAPATLPTLPPANAAADVAPKRQQREGRG